MILNTRAAPKKNKAINIQGIAPAQRPIKNHFLAFREAPVAPSRSPIHHLFSTFEAFTKPAIPKGRLHITNKTNEPMIKKIDSIIHVRGMGISTGFAI